MTLCPIYSSTRNDILQCFVCSPIPKVSEKKGATTQSFIRKEITSYKLHTLGNSVVIRGSYHTKLKITFKMISTTEAKHQNSEYFCFLAKSL